MSTPVFVLTLNWYYDTEWAIVYGFVGKKVNCNLIRNKWQQHSMCVTLYFLSAPTGLMIAITSQYKGLGNFLKE